MLPKLTNDELDEIEREACSRSLAYFVRRAWQVIEPVQTYIHGWHIDAVAEHLEAVTADEILRLYIAEPPGMMKSLMVGCFWPAWEWGPKGLASYRYLGTSHSMTLATRDNLRTRRLIQSEWYQRLWGDKVVLMGDQNAKVKFENDATGFREAMAFTSLTGSRGDRLLMDDVMSVADAASDAKSDTIITNFLEAVPTRLNNPDRSAIVNIQQRLRLLDTIGVSIARELGYEGLVLPMEFELETRCRTKIGFSDPRTEEGELLFPERFPREVVDRDKKVMGSMATASQFQQRPIPREGGMFHRDYFEVIDALPPNITWVRGWDLAATEAKQGRDPAYTAGVKLGVDPDGVYYIGHIARGQLSPAKVERLLKSTASQDGTTVTVDLPQDPGQAGKAQVRTLVKLLAGYPVKWGTETGSKEQRAEPVAAQAEINNIKLLRGPWNEAFLEEAETFPFGKKDQIDGLSRAFSRLVVPVQNDEFAAPIVVTGS